MNWLQVQVPSLSRYQFKEISYYSQCIWMLRFFFKKEHPNHDKKVKRHTVQVQCHNNWNLWNSFVKKPKDCTKEIIFPRIMFSHSQHIYQNVLDILIIFYMLKWKRNAVFLAIKGSKQQNYFYLQKLNVPCYYLSNDFSWLVMASFQAERIHSIFEWYEIRKSTKFGRIAGYIMGRFIKKVSHGLLKQSDYPHLIRCAQFAKQIA